MAYQTDIYHQTALCANHIYKKNLCNNRRCWLPTDRDSLPLVHEIYALSVVVVVLPYGGDGVQYFSSLPRQHKTWLDRMVITKASCERSAEIGVIENENTSCVGYSCSLLQPILALSLSHSAVAVVSAAKRWPFNGNNSPPKKALVGRLDGVEEDLISLSAHNYEDDVDGLRWLPSLWFAAFVLIVEIIWCETVQHATHWIFHRGLRLWEQKAFVKREWWLIN